jgi:hypothetical protein
MNSPTSVQELLRWRLARAEAQAPPAPRAARLLELARPWWETWPERFQKLVTRLGQMQVAYGHAMAETRRLPGEHLVPAIIVHSASETEGSARVLYFSARDGQLRLRFQLNAAQDCAEPVYEATFICKTSDQPLFSAHSERSTNGEYSLVETLSEELAGKWELLKVTDEMPFRLILRPLQSGG